MFVQNKSIGDYGRDLDIDPRDRANIDLDAMIAINFVEVQ